MQTPDPTRPARLATALGAVLLTVAMSLTARAADLPPVTPATPGIVTERPAGEPKSAANPAGTYVAISDGPHAGKFMVAYTHRFPLYADRVVEMKFTPIPGGEFTMGSPADEKDRKPDEGPPVRIRVEPMWVGVYEVTWDQYQPFLDMYSPAITQRRHPRDEAPPGADAISLPTQVWDQDWAPIIYAMGYRGGYPAAGMTELGARMYTKLLSAAGDAFFRIPTEAEWEHATRAGTTTAYCFGDDPSQLKDYAWYFENTEWDDPKKGHPLYGAGYRKVGRLKPNPWGLHDVYGNVAEWCIDQHGAGHYAALARRGLPVDAADAVLWPTRRYPRVLRGGHWDSDASECRSASRLPSTREWSGNDPQVPQSIWHHTEYFMGMRIVRPLDPPDAATQRRFWEPLDETARQEIAEHRQVRMLLDDFRKLDLTRFRPYTERPAEDGGAAPKND